MNAAKKTDFDANDTLDIKEVRQAIDEGEKSGEYHNWNFEDFMKRAKQQPRDKKV